MQIHPRSGIETSILPATWGEFCGVMFTDVICKLHFPRRLTAMRLLGASSNCLNVQYFALASRGASFLDRKGFLQ
jgi:hypothetical protein